VARIPLESFAYVVGKLDLRVAEAESEQLSSSTSVKLHPDYSPETGYSDIAVVKLKDSLCFNKYVQPIRIADRSQRHSGKSLLHKCTNTNFDFQVTINSYSPVFHSLGDAKVSGWGYTLVKTGKNTEAEEDAERAYKRVLEETTVQIMDKEACRKHYAEDLGSRGFAKHPTILCAGHKAGGQDACTGISGVNRLSWA